MVIAGLHGIQIYHVGHLCFCCFNWIYLKLWSYPFLINFHYTYHIYKHHQNHNLLKLVQDRPHTPLSIAILAMSIWTFPMPMSIWTTHFSQGASITNKSGHFRFPFLTKAHNKIKWDAISFLYLPFTRLDWRPRVTITNAFQ